MAQEDFIKRDARIVSFLRRAGISFIRFNDFQGENYKIIVFSWVTIYMQGIYTEYTYRRIGKYPNLRSVTEASTTEKSGATRQNRKQ